MRRQSLAAVLLVMIAVFLVWGTYQHSKELIEPLVTAGHRSSLSPVEMIPVQERSSADWIVIGARTEVSNGTRYDASYQTISYPGGDVSADSGACTDVVIRALRRAGIDLQQLIHEDMVQDFGAYPQKWGLRQPDPNIDHRRVPNQMTFF